MKNGFKLISASALCTLALTSFPVSSMAGGPEVTAPEKPFYYVPRFSAGPFYQTHYGAFGLYDLFVPFTMSRNNILFVDGRYIDRGNTHEYNAGLGFRSLADSGNFLWTLYSFFDDRKSRFGNHFNQVTVGLDFQTLNWYFNANGYIPVGKQKQLVTAFNSAILSGNGIYYAPGYERSMGGGDVELGRTIWGGLKAYVGGYVFSAKNVKTAAGPKIRLQYDLERANGHRIFYIFDKIALIGDWRTDNLVGTTWYGGVRFDIGIGPQQTMTPMERKMTSFVRRDINVELSSDGKTPLHDPYSRLLKSDGTPVTVGLASTTGELTTLTTLATRVDIIGVRGTIAKGAAAATTLLSNQTVEGGDYAFSAGGQNYSVQVGQSGAITTTTATGAALLLANDATSDTLIENMTFSSATAATGNIISDGAGAGNYNSVIIRNNTSSGGDFIGLTGITTGSNSAIIENNNITTPFATSGNGSISVNAGGANTGIVTYTIRGNTINNQATAGNDGVGIRVTGGVGAVNTTIQNNTVNNNIDPTAATALDNAALFLDGSAGPVNVVSELSGNHIVNSDGIGFLAEGNVVFQKGISNNYFQGNSAGTNMLGDNKGANMFTTSYPTTGIGGGQINVIGAVTGNTFVDTANNVNARSLMLEASVPGSAVNFNGGLIANTFNSSGDGFFMGGYIPGALPGTTILVNGLYGNTFNTTGFGISAQVNGAGANIQTVEIRIGGRAVPGTSADVVAQLSALNNNATYTGSTGGAGGTIHITP